MVFLNWEDIMDKFKKMFYKYLIENENFYIIQYYSNFEKKDNYIAVKDVNGKMYCVILVDEKEEDILEVEALEYLKTFNKVFALNAMIFTDGEYIRNSMHNVNRIIVNKYNYKIEYYDEACSPLANISQHIASKLRISPKEMKKKFFEYKVLTMIIIGLNVLMFLLSSYLINKNLNMVALSNGVGVNSLSEKIINVVNNSVLISLGAKYTPLIQEGEVWRFIACAFLHGSILHIACNMYMLYSIGPQIQRIFGSVKYIIIYLISCITSSSLSTIINPNSISVGASGAIFGLMGALLAFSIVERKNINKQYIIGLIKTVGVNLVIGFVVINVDNAAHIGGFLGGIILGFIFYIFGRKRIQL